MLKSKLLMIVVGLVLVVGAGAALFMNDDDSDSNQNTSSSESSNQSNDTASNESNDSKKSDPCTLFSKSDFEKIWGVTLDAKTEKSKELQNPTFKENNCKFEEQHDGSVAGISGSFSFAVKVSTFENSSAAKSRFETDRDALKSLSARKDEVDSPTKVGDGTYFNVAGGDLIKKSESYIVVLKGNEIIDISAVRLDGVDQAVNRDKLIKLAQTKL